MNIKALFRKSVSLILCISMLASLIVMGTFNASAEAVAGTYDFRVKWQCSNGGNSYKTGYSYEGNLTDNGKNYVGFTVLYKDTNGTGEEHHVDKDLGDGSMKNKNNGVWAEWTNVGFPTGLFSHNDHGNALASGELKVLEIQVKKNGAASSAYTSVWSGTLRTKSNINIMEAWINIDGSKGTNGDDAEASGSAWSSKLPKPNSVTFTTVPSNTTVTAPKMGETAKTLQYEATVYDQYGVTWYQPPVYSFATTLNGVSITSSTGLVTVSSDAHSEDGTDTTLTIKAVLTSKTGTSSIKIVNASYNYEFKDLAGTTISHGSLKYGSVVPLPEAPVKPYELSCHYNFSKWAASDTTWDSISGRIHTDTVFTPEYTPENHIFLHYYSDGNATCENDGTKTATCACGQTDTMTDKGSKLGHSLEESITIQPTCEGEGEKTYRCVREGCDYTKTEPIEAIGHNYQFKTVQPTCTQKGYSGYICENCGDSYGIVYTDELGHDWDAGVVTVEPTCLDKGTKLFTCSRCPETKTEEIDQTGHDVKNWVLESLADCTTIGYRHGICKTCHQQIDEYTPALGHDYDEWIEDSVPTCESAGRRHRVCQREDCGYVDVENLDALGHDYQLIIDDPQDCFGGKFYYQCDTCRKYFACVVDEQGNKLPGESGTKSEVVKKTALIPTVEFNTYNRVESHYNYNTRGASLKIDSSNGPDKQAMRFCASVLLPEGATIIDYGYIYSPVFTSDKKFIIGGANVTDVSLINGNHSTFNTDKGTVYTFNLVINVDRTHWNDEFYTRPYIIYTYAGETFTVYDYQRTSRSVMNIAEQVIASPFERESTKEFFNAKIFGK